MKGLITQIGCIFLASLATRAAAAEFKSLIEQRKSHLKEFYQDLHAHPELSGEEKRTAGKVAAEFRALGLEVLENVGGHGVVGVLRNGSGPTTLVRSDLDALPVQEDTKLPYASRVPGKMHACGHDFHTMALVGTAHVLAQTRDQWEGTVLFVAQPAEETVRGAKAMIKDGLFKKVPKPDQLFALHTTTGVKKGVIAVTSGYALANSDSVDVTFRGRGAHGSKPENGIDPFILAAEYTLKMQTLLGREKDAAKPAVISVGSIHGGTKHNIIPEEVRMQLTVRTYEPEVREHIKKRMVEIAHGIAKTAGAPAPVVEFPESTDATYNEPQLAARIKNVLSAQLGAERVVDGKPIMGGEDFGQFGLAVKAPSLFLWIGQRDDKNPTVMNHSPKFAPDFDATATVAVEALTASVMDFHKKTRTPAAGAM